MLIVVILGVGLIVTVLWEAFETIIPPRRVRSRFRLTRFFYRGTWLPWSSFVRKIRSKTRKETLLSFFGPLSLIALLAVWASGLIFGFALLHYGLGSRVRAVEETPTFATDLYVSGTTFFTLGLGDVVPVTWTAHALTVLEAGMGFRPVPVESLQFQGIPTSRIPGRGIQRNEQLPAAGSEHDSDQRSVRSNPHSVRSPSSPIRLEVRLLT